MKVKEAKKLLKASYGKVRKNVDDYEVDNELSGRRVQVYRHKKSGEAFVVHRGTASAKDWLTDAGMAFGMEFGNRFKHSKKIQRAAEQKYGKSNITTLGHSLGGRLAEKYHSGETGQIITLNKAATPKSITQSTPKNQIDIRNSRDVVSYLSKFQKHKTQPITISSNTLNPLKAHNINNLNKVKQDEI